MPDGRLLHLYGEFSDTPVWPAGEEIHEKGYSHRRWHPVRREWSCTRRIARQGLTNPRRMRAALSASTDGEIPVEDLRLRRSTTGSRRSRRTARAAPIPGLDLPVDSAAEIARSSSIRRPQASMSTLSQDRRELLVRVWAIACAP